MKHIYPVCIPAPIAYIQLSETCQLSVQHAHVNQCYVEALLTQGKVSGFLLLKLRLLPCAALLAPTCKKMYVFGTAKSPTADACRAIWLKVCGGNEFDHHQRLGQFANVKTYQLFLSTQQICNENYLQCSRCFDKN